MFFISHILALDFIGIVIVSLLTFFLSSEINLSSKNSASSLPPLNVFLFLLVLFLISMAKWRHLPGL